jgi:hypothetical protein
MRGRQTEGQTMLVIRKEQIEAMERAMMKRLVAKTVVLIRDNLPE